MVDVLAADGTRGPLGGDDAKVMLDAVASEAMAAGQDAPGLHDALRVLAADGFLADGTCRFDLDFDVLLPEHGFPAPDVGACLASHRQRHRVRVSEGTGEAHGAGGSGGQPGREEKDGERKRPGGPVVGIKVPRSSVEEGGSYRYMHEEMERRRKRKRGKKKVQGVTQREMVGPASKQPAAAGL